VDIYYQDKARLRDLHPEPEPVENPKGRSWKFRFTDSHIHRMARRRMIKIFLEHLWVRWRESEGLPAGEPWVIRHGGHADYIPPPPLYE
jgi:hypothetical protein